MLLFPCPLARNEGRQGSLSKSQAPGIPSNEKTQKTTLTMSSNEEGSDESVKRLVCRRGVGKYSHIKVEDTTWIDVGAFEDCKEHLSVVEICEGVEEIGEKAFYDCEHLESLSFPQTY